MQVITIESEAFQQLLDQLEEIKASFRELSKKQPLSEAWLDNQDVCHLLHISKRTLQSLRDNNILPYSQRDGSGKIYYKAKDIEKYLNDHYQSPDKPATPAKKKR